MTSPKALNESISKEVTEWAEATALFENIVCSMPCDDGPCENQVIVFLVMIAGEGQKGVGATCLEHISQLSIFGEVAQGDFSIRHRRKKEKV